MQLWMTRTNHGNSQTIDIADVVGYCNSPTMTADRSMNTKLSIYFHLQ